MRASARGGCTRSTWQFHCKRLEFSESPALRHGHRCVKAEAARGPGRAGRGLEAWGWQGQGVLRGSCLLPPRELPAASPAPWSSHPAYQPPHMGCYSRGAERGSRSRAKPVAGKAELWLAQPSQSSGSGISLGWHNAVEQGWHVCWLATAAQQQ